ncbi:MAG: hypothetical protein ACTSR0_01910 [Candidatus Asgardarchaeia archaeon]
MIRKKPLIAAIFILLFASTYVLGYSTSYAIETNSVYFTTMRGSGHHVNSTEGFSEFLKITAGKNTSTIIEIGFSGMDIEFSHINISHPSFNNLVNFLIVAKNGIWSRKYWPRPLLPYPQGVYLKLVYVGIDAGKALSRAYDILSMVEEELGISGLLLFSIDDKGGMVEIVFYSDFPEINYSFESFIGGFWSNYLPTSGLGELVNETSIISSELSVAFLSIDADTDFTRPSIFVAYINPEGIEDYGNGTYTISVNKATSHEGNITASEDSSFSVIIVRIPYVGNATDWYPETDNLFPDLSGTYVYHLVPEGPVKNNNCSDIWITYNLNYSKETEFPVIKARYWIEPVLPEFNFNETITIRLYTEVENVGNETAYDVSVGIPVPLDILLGRLSIGGDKPANLTEIFLWKLVEFINESEDFKEIFEDYANQTIVSVYDPNPQDYPDLIRLITFYYIRQYAEGVIVNFRKEIMSEFEYEGENPEKLWINATSESDNMEKSEDYLEFKESGMGAFVGKLEQLAKGESYTFYFDITIPGIDRIVDPLNNTIHCMNYPTSIKLEWENYNVTFTLSEEVKNLTRDGLKEKFVEFRNEVVAALSQEIRSEYWGSELGPLVTFEDKVGHHYFVLANGIYTQINDEQPVIVGQVELSDYSFLIDQSVNITVTIENIVELGVGVNGENYTAKNVFIEVYHGLADYAWNIRNMELIDSVSLGDIGPGENVSVIIPRRVTTRIGLHPVFVKITYEDDDGNTLTVFSNGLFAIVYPKFADRPKPDYPFPTPELEISKSIVEETVREGDEITVNITIVNVGDEATRVVVIDTLNGSAFALPGTYTVKVNGEDITDNVEKIVLYEQFFQTYGLPISKIGFAENFAGGRTAGILLNPGDVLTITYKVKVKSAGDVMMYPMMVIYTSLHPVLIKGESEEGGEGGASASSISALSGIHILEGDEGGEEITTYSTSFTLVIEEGLSQLPLGNLAMIAIITLMVTSAVIILNQRRKKSITPQFSM